MNSKDESRAVVSLTIAAITLLGLPAAGSPCVELVAELPDGPALAVDLEGDLAVYGSGRVLIIADLTDPTHPVELGRSVLDGVVQAIHTVDDLAYVAMGETGLAIVDLSDPSAPLVVGAVAAAFGKMIDVAADGSFAYVAERAHPTEHSTTTFLLVIDASVPSQPVLAGSVETQFRSPYRLAASGDVVFMVTFPHLWPAPTGKAIRVYDVSDPGRPTELGVPTSSLWAANGIAVVGDELFVVGEEYLGRSMLEIFDIGGPSSPVPIGSLDLEGFGQTDVAVVDGHAVVTTTDGLKTVDVSDPGNPVIVGSLGRSGRGLQAAARWPLAVVAADADGLRIIDISTPAEPATLGGLRTPGSADFIRIAGDLAVVSAKWRSYLGVGDARVVDLSDPTQPIDLGSLPVDPERGRVVVEDSRAFVMTGGHGGREPGLSIVDMSDPTAAFEEGFLATDAISFDMDVQWPYAYLAGHGRLRVIDVGSPGFPVQVSSMEIERHLYSVVVQGNHAFVGRFVNDVPNVQTLQALDVADPRNPVELGFVGTGPYWNLASRDGLVYGGATHGLAVADVHDPTAPGRVFSTKLDPARVTHRYVVGMDGQTVAVAKVRPDHDRDPDARERVVVFDLDDPRRPMRSALFEVPFRVKDVGVAGDLVYVAGGNAGVYVYDVGSCEARGHRHSSGRVAP